MHILRLVSIAITLCLLGAVPREPAARVEAARGPLPYAPGEVIVKLKPDAIPAAIMAEGGGGGQLLSLARAAGERAVGRAADSVEPLAPVGTNARLARIISDSGLDRTFVLRFSPDADVHAIVESLRAGGAVEYAEPNYHVKLGSVTPDDPRFADQWGLINLGLSVEGWPSTPNADIKATEAWELTTGSPDVIVAVTDTGVDITHPDLARNVYTNPGEIAGNAIDDDRNGYVDDVNGFNVADQNGDVSDIVGHGTQMAGIIAAEMGNFTGIAGVSQSKILPVRFFKKTGPFPDEFQGSVADAARSLVYALAAGARVINASWSTLLPVNRVPAQDAQALKDAVTATNQAGALLVCIAGNEGFDNDVSFVYPGSYQLSNQIVVAASDYNDEIWHPPLDPFTIKTGFGMRSVHLTAPGVSVLTTAARGDCVLCSDSDEPSDWYSRIDGTSAAAAFVSGAAALVKSRHPEAGVTIVRRRLLESVDVFDKLRRYVATSGRLNAAAALTVELVTVPPVLTRLKYKAGSEKLLLYGEQIRRGAVALVGGVRYATKVKNGDLSRVFARVPASAFPRDIEVEVRIENEDGGVSSALSIRR
jgi:subtilisin family serine protease